MRFPLLAFAAFSLLPLPAVAQNLSIIVQDGDNNNQLTVQSGHNFAITAQLGGGNSATTVQSGEHTYSSIVQVGEDHEQTHIMTEDYSALGSVQVDAIHSSWSSTSTAGSAGGVTLYFEVD